MCFGSQVRPAFRQPRQPLSPVHGRHLAVWPLHCHGLRRQLCKSASFSTASPCVGESLSVTNWKSGTTSTSTAKLIWSTRCCQLNKTMICIANPIANMVALGKAEIFQPWLPKNNHCALNYRHTCIWTRSFYSHLMLLLWCLFQSAVTRKQISHLRDNKISSLHHRQPSCCSWIYSHK